MIHLFPSLFLQWACVFVMITCITLSASVLSDSRNVCLFQKFSAFSSQRWPCWFSQAPLLETYETSLNFSFLSSQRKCAWIHSLWPVWAAPSHDANLLTVRCGHPLPSWPCLQAQPRPWHFCSSNTGARARCQGSHPVYESQLPVQSHHLLLPQGTKSRSCFFYRRLLKYSNA